jgi:hypothetical protein
VEASTMLTAFPNLVGYSREWKPRFLTSALVAFLEFPA